MKGRLIAIEGLDGTGKSTLAVALSRWLGAVQLSTPGALAAARGAVDAAGGLAAQLYYAASVVLAAAQAETTLAAGRDVVCDRYWLSTWVYARERGGGVDLDEVEALLPAADCTLLCEVDDPVRGARLHQRGPSSEDLRTLDALRAARLRACYREGLSRRVAGRGVVLDLTPLSKEAALAAALRALGGHPLRGTRAA